MRTILLFLASALALHAEVTLAPLFVDHAVLQQGKPVPVWGRADPGERVSVTFGAQSVGTTADRSGRWLVYLDALPASREPAELIVTGKNTLRVADVLVGEVWLCSGQSNMEWPVRDSQNAAEEIAAANYPLIRQIKIQRTVAETPAETVQTEGWQPATPETVGLFTAVGYFFGRDLHARLNVPIGLINSTWGGTFIESWMSPAALLSDSSFTVVPERWRQTLAEYPERKKAYEAALAEWTAEEAAAKERGEPFTKRRPGPPAGSGHHQTPSALFNGMIHPLLPYALRGAIWYQGESNALRHQEYGQLFSAMITYWRKHFGQPDFPFLWVQLAGFQAAGDPSGRAWAFLREAQAQTLSLPNTGMAITIDIGEKTDIHPRNKQEVGRRLALIARTKVYDLPADHSGPVFSSVVREGNALRVKFRHAESGLIARDRELQSFEIAGADRVFRPALARIERDTVVVSAPDVREPAAVRYAWANFCEANLYNGAGLPAAPFRSDNW